MLKVLCIVDKTGTALDRLAKGVSKYHDNIDYQVVDFHPKRPDIKQIDNLSKHSNADIIDAQYFRSIETVRAMFPGFKNIPTILTHNNPYSIEEKDWNDYDYNVGNNQYIYKRLGEITEKPVSYIPLTVDTDFWKFNSDWSFVDKVNSNNKYEWKNGGTKPSVIMVANRIESKKGILPVAIAANELGLRFVLVGAISDANYFQAIMASGNVEFHEQVTDEELRELYYKSTIHVCNSVDNFESGTLPILEAMLCGVPVLTREVGHVPDLFNGENMTLLEGQPEDVYGIQAKLEEMLGDKKKLSEQRDKAWQTAKSRSFERRAYMYQKLYREVLHPDQTPVSVVVPIYDKPEIIRKCLSAIAEQTYKNIELIVVNDNYNQNGLNSTLTKEYSQFINYPMKYMNTSELHGQDRLTELGVTTDRLPDNYGLARARNMGTIEATGEVIVYCDQRMIMEPTAIEEFLKHLTSRTWVYGNKGGKKDFVENFSAVYRHRVIQSGMFCERIIQYGGMSEELRKRLNRQGVTTEYVESAKAMPTGKSSNRNRKRDEIIRMKNRVWKMYDAE